MLKHVLSINDLILDEIQYQWQQAPQLITKIVQIVDGIKATHRVFLLGTPPFGDVDISFDEHARGRMLTHLIPSFTGIEVYSLLKKKLLEVDFEKFLELWSCFNGIPGLYELALKTGDSIPNASKLFDIVMTSCPLTNDEKIFLIQINPQDGMEVSKDKLNDPILIRLKEHGAIIQYSDRIFIRDRVLLSISIISNDSMLKKEKLQNLCGYGLESLTKSIANIIISDVGIVNAFRYEEVSLGYGESDLDLVYRFNNTIVCFSCKVDPEKHDVSFLNNMEKHLKSRKPPTLHLILCSPITIPKKNIQDKYVNSKPFTWNPNFFISYVSLSDLIPKLATDQQFFEYDDAWPYLNRIKVLEDLKKISFRLIRVCGFRRVGKTFSVCKAVPSGIYIDFKQL